MLTALAINAIAVIFAFLGGRGRKGLMTVSQLMLSVVYGIRYDYGNDYWNYYDGYLKCMNGLDAFVHEPGWAFINIICQPIGYFGMIFVLTCIEYYIVYSHIRKFVVPKYWWMAVFIFTFSFNFQLLGCTMMRQFLAMTILLYTVDFVEQRNILKVLCVIGTAVSIHLTAVIFVPFIILYFWQPALKKFKWILAFVAGFCILLLVSTRYIEYFQLAAVIFGDDKFNSYLMQDGNTYSFTIMFDILWMVLLMVYYPRELAPKFIVCISLISYIILPFTFVAVMLVRLMLFFSFFFILSIPRMFKSMKEPILRYGLCLIYSFFLIRRSLASLTSETYKDFYETFQTIFSAPSWL